MRRSKAAHRPAARFRGLRRELFLGALVPVADRPIARLLGLAQLDLERAGAGLLLERCSAVHTFGMRFELDLVFLDAGGEVLRIERAVRPRRFLRERGAAAVLELPRPVLRDRGAGSASAGLSEASTGNDRIER
jgi:uncharacterized protein